MHGAYASKGETRRIKKFLGQYQLPAGKIMAATCVMSDQLLEDLREQARTLAREAAEAAIKARRASAKGASASAPATQAGSQIPGCTPKKIPSVLFLMHYGI